jgi:hypothetical protein
MGWVGGFEFEILFLVWMAALSTKLNVSFWIILLVREKM